MTLLASILLTLVLTYPLVFELTTSIPGFEDADTINYAWSNWWFDKALFDLHQSPAEMDYIYYPIGADHPKEIASIWAKIVSVPAISFLGVDSFTVYSLNLLAANVLTLFFMTWLCWELTGSRGAGLVGGLIFAFSVNRVNQMLHGHLTQSMTYFYPLLVLALVRLWRDPGIWRGLLFGLILGLATLVDLLPLAFFVGPVTVTLLLFLLVTNRQRFFSRQFQSSLLPGLLLAMLLVLPFYLPLLTRASQGELEWYQIAGVVEYSADALAFVIPNPEHLLARALPALRDLSSSIYGFALSQSEGTVYLGWITIILALLGLVKTWDQHQDVKYWFTVAFASIILALGPWLRAGGRIITVGGRPLILPYAAMLYIPLVSWGRTPGRLGLTAIFACAILAAYGLSWLLSRQPTRKARLVMVAVLSGLILLDSLWVFPWPGNDRQIPSIYQELAADQRHVAVLDLPVEGYVPAKYYMLYQMTHGHAIVGGWRDRRSPEVEEKMVEFEALAGPGGDLDALAQAGIGYVLLHDQFLESADRSRLKAHLDTELGGPVYQDNLVVVYRLQGVAEIAPPPIPTS